MKSLNLVWLLVTPWTAAHQAPPSMGFSRQAYWSGVPLPSPLAILVVIIYNIKDPSNHLILFCPLLLLPSVFPSIRVFSNESALCTRWLKNWTFSLSIRLSINIQGWYPLGLTGLISLLSKELSRVFSSTTVRKHPFFGAQPYLWSNSHTHTWLTTGNNHLCCY